VRTEPGHDGSELTLLTEYLDYQRGTVLAKTEGLTPAQLTAVHPPSELTHGGLLYHLALVEETWMEVRFGGLPERDRSRQVVAAASGPDQLSARPRRDGRHFSLRWVLLHLIEETARHAGHADLLREAIDGSVGE